MIFLEKIFSDVEKIPGFICAGVVYGEDSLHKTLVSYHCNKITTIVRSFKKSHFIYIKI